MPYSPSIIAVYHFARGITNFTPPSRQKNILKHKSCLRDVLFVYVFSRFIETNFAGFNWLKVAKLSETKNKQSLENFTYLYRDDFIKAIYFTVGPNEL